MILQSPIAIIESLSSQEMGVKSSFPFLQSVGEYRAGFSTGLTYIKILRTRVKGLELLRLEHGTSSR